MTTLSWALWLLNSSHPPDSPLFPYHLPFFPPTGPDMTSDKKIGVAVRFFEKGSSFFDRAFSPESEDDRTRIDEKATGVA